MPGECRGPSGDQESSLPEAIDFPREPDLIAVPGGNFRGLPRRADPIGTRPGNAVPRPLPIPEPGRRERRQPLDVREESSPVRFTDLRRDRSIFLDRVPPPREGARSPGEATPSEAPRPAPQVSPATGTDEKGLDDQGNMNPAPGENGSARSRDTAGETRSRHALSRDTSPRSAFPECFATARPDPELLAARRAPRSRSEPSRHARAPHSGSPRDRDGPGSPGSG